MMVIVCKINNWLAANRKDIHVSQIVFSNTTFFALPMKICPTGISYMVTIFQIFQIAILVCFLLSRSLCVLGWQRNSAKWYQDSGHHTILPTSALVRQWGIRCRGHILRHADISEEKHDLWHHAHHEMVTDHEEHIRSSGLHAGRPLTEATSASQVIL